MRSPKDRYLNDATYSKLVDALEQIIDREQLTPSEVREAAMLACIHYELRNPIPTPLVHNVEEALETLQEFRKRYS